ncbi:SAP30-binding protein [Microplitis demolitor]|uniref:SAP30-binding protein n=1 Tax=Microplitis demolitor TaxID=69319 RepID=UPI0004CD69F3|nr:SAP30-binding protein [Microplitis demolitor]XP_008551882.1 SAP30-binding protein [Microplitis demolitor]XP_053596426.1 SAP30-binding protein [Microplitis demolitor]XP_053596429.1 SAP30-binding protein [Microplitis demolitor]XP_053596436.1 SAP30-binding protein [Microplitis demolitor]
MSVQSVALASLTATYTDSEGEDGVDDELQETNSTPQGAAPYNNAQVGQPQQAHTSPKSGRSASNSPNVASGVGKKSISNLPNSAPSSTLFSNDNVSVYKVHRLVSYFDDTVVSDDEGVLNTTTEGEPPNENGVTPSVKSADKSPSRHYGELVSDGGDDDPADPDGIVIPPEPVGQYPPDLQEKITVLFRKMESKGGVDMNQAIQQRKDFRNPSIYEKLIQFCSINELGTNYPPERFDPFKWGKDSYYEELAKVQKAEMDKLEKARKEKTKIEIVSGTAKRPSNSAPTVEEDAKKRKSKWDQVATGAVNPAPSVKPTVLLSQPTLTINAASATKATVISAFGSLPKKRL